MDNEEHMQALVIKADLRTSKKKQTHQLYWKTHRTDVSEVVILD